jgi:hypothetical protein
MSTSQVGKYLLAKQGDPSLSSKGSTTAETWTSDARVKGFNFTEQDLISFMEVMGGHDVSKREELLRAIEAEEAENRLLFGAINFSPDLQEHVVTQAADGSCFASFASHGDGGAFANTCKVTFEARPEL